MYLNNKSNFSLLQSASKVDDIVKFAKDNNLNYIGLCDNNTIEGAFDFISISRKNGVKPIISVDTFCLFNDKIISVILVAKDTKAFFEINKIISGIYQNYINIFDIENSYVIVKSNNNLDNDTIKDLSEKENIYIGLHEIELLDNFKINEKYLLIEETYFPQSSDFEFYKLIVALRENSKINKVREDQKKKSFLKIYNYLENEKLKRLNENFLKLSKNIKYNNIDYAYKIPHVSDFESGYVYLEKLSKKGLLKRFGKDVKVEYIHRLEKELKVIKELDFSNYFIVVLDIIKYCKKENIYVGPGRGSAAASLISYTLGITNIDPIKYNLIFERFLNTKRLSMPDIDIDIEDTSREKVFQYLLEKYGSDYVCKIGTLNTYQTKSSFREVANAFNVDKNLIGLISKEIDSSKSIIENMSNKKIANEFAIRSELKYILDYIIRINGFYKNRSIHAAGVIISPNNLYNYTAFENKSISITSAKELETMGLVKFDLLALSNLRFIHEIVDKIKNETGKIIEVNKLDLTDEKVYKMFSTGQTNDVFQFESQGIRNVLERYKPNKFTDLAVILALYRPGPMHHIEDYINRKNKKVKYDYYFKELNDILSETYGIIVYQEQIIQVVQEIAGYDLAKADIFRRVISKKKEKELITALGEFKADALKRGFEEAKIDALVQDIMKFALYGFNKAHAVSYAYVSYTIQYLKVNYPKEFALTALKYIKTESQYKELLSELKYLKISILSPNINISNKEPKILGNDIILGFENIKLLSNELIDKLIERRKSKVNDDNDELKISSLVTNLMLTEDVASNLVFSGLFSDFKYNEKEIFNYIMLQSNVDSDLLEVFQTTVGIEKSDNYDIIYLEKKEKEALNINLKHKSFEEVFKRIYKRNRNIKLLESIKRSEMQGIKTLLRVEEIKKIKTKTNQSMCFVIASSYNEVFELVIFSNVYLKYEKEIEIMKNKLIYVQVNKKDKKYYINNLKNN